MKTSENIGNIIGRLRLEAVSAAICKQGLDTFDSYDSIKGLIGYYVENPDWCIERGFPSVGLLREMDKEGLLVDSGICIDRVFNGETLNGRQVYVFHNCSGWIRTGLNIDEELIPMFYLANGSDLVLSGGFPKRRNIARVPVYTSEDSVAVSRDGDGVRFVRYEIKSERI